MLDRMMKDDFTWRDIARILGRTENAVRNAFRNIVYHQLLDNKPIDVATKYNMTVEDLRDTIVHPKYALDESKPFPWKTMLSLLAFGGAYYTHLLYKNWTALGY